jgi:hypothetical protein
MLFIIIEILKALPTLIGVVKEIKKANEKK